MKSENHRVGVGAVRRAQMRMRLIDSTMLVFPRRGVDGAVIDEVIDIAGVSRGTFYNYFRTHDELLIAVAEEVDNEFLHVVHLLLQEHAAGSARVAAGIRLTLMLAQAHPRLAAFLGRTGPAALGSHGLATEIVPRDIADAAAAGQFTLHAALAGVRPDHRPGALCLQQPAGRAARSGLSPLCAIGRMPTGMAMNHIRRRLQPISTSP